MNSTSRLFSVILSSTILLLFSGCTPKNTTDNTSDTEAQTTQQQEENANEDEQPNTIGAPKTEIDFSRVQVVDEKRFMEEVCEFDDAGRYGFKCTRPIIIDFTAGWCGWCTKLSPHLVDMAQKYSDQIAVYKVDVDKCPNIAQRFNIQGLPTLVIVKPHHQPERIEGYVEKDKLEEIIQNKLLSK